MRSSRSTLLFLSSVMVVVALLSPAGPAHARRPWGPAPGPAIAPVTAPAQARAIVEKLQKRRLELYRKLEAQLAPARRRAVKQLQALQDRYTRAAKLDEALAIRTLLRQVSGVRPDPGALRAQPGDVGKAFLYEVVGSTSGTIWGTQTYTTDSHLATAAVHAGVLRPGERGVVRVWILPGQPSYQGSAQNGVTSNSYGGWGLSFSVERR